mgnify:FL=1
MRTKASASTRRASLDLCRLDGALLNWRMGQFDVGVYSSSVSCSNVCRIVPAHTHVPDGLKVPKIERVLDNDVNPVDVVPGLGGVGSMGYMGHFHG